MTSWKTTAGGLLAAMGALLSVSSDSTLHAIGQICAAVGALILGVAARDNNVSSEEAGIKKENKR